MFRVATNGGFKGTISCLNAPYGINHSQGSSNLRLTRYDNAGHAVWEENSTAGQEQPTEESPSSSSSSNPVADTTIDVLVLYNTSLAGVSIWQDAIDQIYSIRTAMTVSTSAGQPTIADVRLAGAAWIVRNASGVSNRELQFLQASPKVAELRDYYAADLILYVNSGSCIPPPGGAVTQGISYIPGLNGVPNPPAPNWAYAAVLHACSDNPGDWVSAHEIAHLFGANHNMDQQPANPSPLEPFAWAHWARLPGSDPREGAKTLMAYPDQCDAVTELCPRLQHYSNPNVSVSWFTTGTALHDNAMLIQEYAPVLAGYRDSQGRIFRSGFDY